MVVEREIAATPGNSGACLVVQSDGNVVLYSAGG
jgi:hypothetical protein